MNSTGRCICLLGLGVAAGAAASIANAQSPPVSPSTAFDGRWAVSLVCDDVRDNGTFAKGYAFDFFVDIRAGRLTGQYGQPGLPASLTLTGTVAEDGTAEISAQGRTGRSEYTVGHVQTSTPYGYHMRGSFTGTAGSATRTELRPCRAAFSRP